ERAAKGNRWNSWIPARPNDRLQIPIKVLSRKPGDATFLRPAKDSPLATGGAGAPGKALASLASVVGAAPGGMGALRHAWVAATEANAFDPSLPAYVGAVPPEGVEPWDWGKTWKAKK